MSQKTRKNAIMKRMCWKKEQFDSIAEAGIRAAYLYLNNGWVNSVYECQHCKKYHHTTKRKISNVELEALQEFVSEQRFTRCDRPTGLYRIANG